MSCLNHLNHFLQCSVDAVPSSHITVWLVMPFKANSSQKALISFGSCWWLRAGTVFSGRSAELRAPISGQHLWPDESALACPEMDVQDGWNRKKIAFMIRCKLKINLEKWHQKQQLGVDSSSNFKSKHCISIAISWIYLI